ncbi:MAG: electron transfer flavoprotein subunit alpha/FixB family protein [Saprospiraceae bacterium]
MNCIVLAEHSHGTFKKVAFEAITYGRTVAEQTGGKVKVLVLGPAADLSPLATYGVPDVIHITDEALKDMDSQLYIAAIAKVAQAEEADLVIMSHTSTGKQIAGGLSVRLKAGLVTGAKALPETGNQFSVDKNVFSGKAVATVGIKSPVKVISVMPNSIPVGSRSVSIQVEAKALGLSPGRVRVKQVERVEGSVPLPEAERVVSAGRGMKGPEHWGIIEDLASELQAATACSRPVADSGWRPHHEHVGQTGLAIRPNLYVAIGISGAIQHLAGVNSSKTIVVINKDPEAPFFKAADYGVVGDLFDVVPRLTEAVRKFNAEH